MKDFFKKYFLYFAWLTAFYLVLKFISRFTGRITFSISLIIVFTAVIFLKKYLPFLKDKKFPEIISFLDWFNAKLAQKGLWSKKCAVCNLKVDFKIVIQYNIGKDLNARKQKTFCCSHGLIELRKIIERYQILIIFSEPGIKQKSSSFFYEPAQLKIHGYSDQDRREVEKLIAQFPREHTYEWALWLPREVIGDCRAEPLFKRKFPGEHISVDELIKRMRILLQKLELRFKNGEYWLTEPHGESGIYIWGTK